MNRAAAVRLHAPKGPIDGIIAILWLAEASVVVSLEPITNKALDPLLPRDTYLFLVMEALQLHRGVVLVDTGNG